MLGIRVFERGTTGEEIVMDVEISYAGDARLKFSLQNIDCEINQVPGSTGGHTAPPACFAPPAPRSLPADPISLALASARTDISAAPALQAPPTLPAPPALKAPPAPPAALSTSPPSCLPPDLPADDSPDRAAAAPGGTALRGRTRALPTTDASVSLLPI